MKIRVSHVLLVILLLFIGGFLTFCGMFIYEYNRREEGKNATSVSWLPKTATDISYVRIMFCKEAKFKIPEPDFIEFAKSEGFRLEEIKKTVTIQTQFLDSEERNRLYETKSVSIEQLEALDWKITHGLYFEEQHDNGGCLIFAYDRDMGVGYYLWIHH